MSFQPSPPAFDRWMMYSFRNKATQGKEPLDSRLQRESHTLRSTEVWSNQHHSTSRIVLEDIVKQCQTSNFSIV